ncbi:MAG: nucleoside triphosphate pyrophosphohydrolase [Planctomycetota bacterium]
MSADPITSRVTDPAAAAAAFKKLVDVVATLRGPEGCPWDRAQTLETIKAYTLEETYELLEAIDAGDDDAIAEELGDVLLQVVLDAQIAADEGRFDVVPVVERLTEKLVRRHPHVFGDATVAHADEVSPLWEKAKAAESEKAERESIFDGVPAALPQLARAAKLSKRAAKVGYDFPHRDMLFDKLREEIAELVGELYGPESAGTPPSHPASIEGEPVKDVKVTDPAARKKAEGELGDVLFVVANIARRWGLDPEEALRASNAKFERRVRFIESELRAAGRTIADATLAEQEAIYQEGKRRERRGG